MKVWVFYKNMVINDVLKAFFIIAPNQINITKAFTVEHAKQITALVFYQEVKSGFHLTFKLVINISEDTFADRLDFFVFFPCVSIHLS